MSRSPGVKGRGIEGSHYKRTPVNNIFIKHKAHYFKREELSLLHSNFDRICEEHQKIKYRVFAEIVCKHFVGIVSQKKYDHVGHKVLEVSLFFIGFSIPLSFYKNIPSQKLCYILMN